MANQPRPGSVPVPGTPPVPAGPPKLPNAKSPVQPAAAAATAPPGAAPVADYQSGQIVVRTSFWQSQMVQDVLPFVTSLLIHLGIVVLIVATASVVKILIDPP